MKTRFYLYFSFWCTIEIVCESEDGKKSPICKMYIRFRTILQSHLMRGNFVKNSGIFKPIIFAVMFVCEWASTRSQIRKKNAMTNENQSVRFYLSLFVYHSFDFVLHCRCWHVKRKTKLYLQRLYALHSIKCSIC